MKFIFRVFLNFGLILFIYLTAEFLEWESLSEHACAKEKDTPAHNEDNGDKTNMKSVPGTDQHALDPFTSLLDRGPMDLVSWNELNVVPRVKNPCFWPKYCKIESPTELCVQQLRCLPYFVLIGNEKCGTSYLYWSLVKHQHVHGASKKETHYFDDIRNPASWTFAIHHGTLEGYTAMFDNISHPYATGPTSIRECILNHTSLEPCPNILTDFTPRYLVASFDWFKEWYNHGLDEPLIWTPHKLRALLPHAKLLITLRNPAKRLFSSYRYFSKKRKLEGVSSLEEFHNRAVAQIAAWNRCVQAHGGFRRCLFPIEAEPELSDFWNERGIDQLRMGLYILYIKEWLAVFPRNQILFINFEKYVIAPLEYTVEHILPFLGIEPYTEEYFQLLKERDNQRRLTKPDDRYGELAHMSNQTRHVLDEFYAPFNSELAQLLRDESYLWHV